MGAIPDQFDVFVRRARERFDPARAEDMLIGNLFALKEWHLLNAGTAEDPRPRFAELDGTVFLLVFSHPEKADAFTEARGERGGRDPLGLISMRPGDAADYCRALRGSSCGAILVNPGPFAYAVALEGLLKYHEAWSRRGAELASGFWIPNMTTEEEDFWQEHEL